MNEAVLRIGGASLYGFGILAVVSYLWGSFVYYKKAVVSHFENFQVLDSVVMSAFWGFILGRISFAVFNWQIFWNHLPRVFLLSNYPGLERWGTLAGITLGLLISVRRVKAKYLDWLDLACLGILSGAAVFFAGLSIMTGNLGYLLLGFLYLTMFIWTWNAEDKYRTFTWYRGKRTSARSGFIAGFSVAFLGIVFILEKLLFRQVGLVGILWGLVLFVGGLVLVYIRSGRTAAEDIKFILKKYGRK